MKKPIIFGGARAMWLLVMYDVPMDTKEAREEYAELRKKLLKNGLNRLQFSVYYRHVPSPEYLKGITDLLEELTPPDGHVRAFQFTDLQFAKQLIFYGKQREATEGNNGDIVKKKRKKEKPPNIEVPLQISFF